MEKEQVTYEIMYFLNPLVAEDKVVDETNSLRSLIEGVQGIIISEDKPKFQDLAYPIKRHEKGFLGMIKFISKPDSLEKLKNSLDRNEKLVRFMISKSKIEKESSKPKRTFIKKAESAENLEVKAEEIDKKLTEILGE